MASDPAARSYSAQANTASEPELDALFLAALQAFERGGDAAVDEVCAAHPASSEALRKRIEGLRRAGLWGESAALATAELPERLGEFRLVRVLGAGGMGVVYLARQEPLNRQVALKVVRPERLFFPGARERFRREIETVARLQHPGIVPVYTVGEHQGVPYFAMEYVVGRTLEHALTALEGRRPETLRGSDLAQDPAEPNWLFEGSWEDACLRVVRQVADALEHAHRRGVLHRDIKPSNVMLTSDGTSRALLFDFGLAIAAHDASLTKSDVRLGSLPYMAPEQARGELDAMDARSDVYSLGVTLYELLTLQRAFRGKSEIDVLRAIQSGERRRPRDWNAALSIEAETVCLTAMETDPARRYASAAEFARDLANVLERRPIEAQRLSPWLVARRWVARRPAVATALALAVSLLVAVPSIWIWQARGRAKDLQSFNDNLQLQLTATQAAEREARDKSARAKREATRARDAIDQFLRKVGEDHLKSVPGADKLRTELLDDAAQLYEDILAEDPDNPESRADLANSLRVLGARQAAIGQHETADRYAARSIELLRSLLGTEGDTFHHRHLLATALAERGTVQVERGVTDAEAEAQVREAIGILGGLISKAPDDFELQRSLILCQMDLGTLRRFAGSMPEALECVEAAEEAALLVVGRDPTMPPILLSIQANIAAMRQALGDAAGAAQGYARALETADELLANSAATVETRHAAAVLELNLGNLLVQLERSSEARVHAASSVRRFEQLTSDFPTQVLYKRGLGESLLCHWRAAIRDDRNLVDELGARVESTFDQVLAASPSDARARNQLANYLRERAHEDFELGRTAEAFAALQRAVVHALQLAQMVEPQQIRNELLALRVEVLAARQRSPACAELASQFTAQVSALFPGDPEFAQSGEQ